MILEFLAHCHEKAYFFATPDFESLISQLFPSASIEPLIVQLSKAADLDCLRNACCVAMNYDAESNKNETFSLFNMK